MARFVSYCEHDAASDCVLWKGGTTAGHGHFARYGAFWFSGRRWLAHRWAARFIHGLDIEEKQIDHCCPHVPRPNTLCVQHLQAVTATVNRELQWIRVQVGADPYPYGEETALKIHSDVPFWHPPSWLKPYKEVARGQCPF
jgi:hypothetical protein